jgi:hypothetical protein
VHHRTIQIKHQPDATVFEFIILTFVYSSTSFGRFPAHHQELNDCSLQPPVLPSYRGDSRAVFVVGPVGRPDHEHVFKDPVLTAQQTHSVQVTPEESRCLL